MVLSLFLSLTAVRHSPAGLRSHAAREQLAGHTPNKKERSLFPEQRIFLVRTVPEPAIVFLYLQEEILSTFVGQYYNFQAALACKPHFYIGIMK